MTAPDVVVVRGNPLLCAGIAAALAPMLVTHDAGMSDVPPWTGTVRPRLLVADHEAALQALAARSAGRAAAIPWLVVTPTVNGVRVRQALEAGVTGYVHASCQLDALLEAARAVAAGRRHLCPQAAAALAEGLFEDALTPREVDVLKMLSLGLDNKSISRRLGVELGTVKSHMKSVMGKLHVHSRTQALVEALRRGLLDDLLLDRGAQDDRLALHAVVTAEAIRPCRSRETC